MASWAQHNMQRQSVREGGICPPSDAEASKWLSFQGINDPGRVFDQMHARDLGVAHRTQRMVFPKRDTTIFFWKLVMAELREKVFKKSYPTVENFPKKTLQMQEAWKQNLTAEENKLNGELYSIQQRFYELTRIIVVLHGNLADKFGIRHKTIEDEPAQDWEVMISDLSAFLFSGIARMSFLRKEINDRQIGGKKFAQLVKKKTSEKEEHYLHGKDELDKMLEISKVAKAVEKLKNKNTKNWKKRKFNKKKYNNYKEDKKSKYFSDKGGPSKKEGSPKENK